MDGSERSTSIGSNNTKSDAGAANFGNTNELFRRIDSKSPPSYAQDAIPSFLAPTTPRDNTPNNPASNPTANPAALPKAGSAFPKVGSAFPKAGSTFPPVGRPASDSQPVPPPLMTPTRPAEVRPSMPPLTSPGRPPETQITPPQPEQGVPQQRLPQQRTPELPPQHKQLPPERPRPDQQRPPEQQLPKPDQKPPSGSDKAWRFNQEPTKPKEDNSQRAEWMVRQMDKLLSMGVGSLKFDAIPQNAEPRFWKDEQGHFLYFKNYGDPNKRYHLSKALATVEMCGKTFDLDKIRTDIDNQVFRKREAEIAADDSPNSKWSFKTQKLDGNTEVVSVFDSGQHMRFQQTFKGGNLVAVVELDIAEQPKVKMAFGPNGLAKIEIRVGQMWNKYQKRGDTWQPSDTHIGAKLESYVKPYYLRKPG